MGIQLHFQQDGKRNNDGHYVIEGWGAIDQHWVKQQLPSIKAILEDA